MSTQIKKHVIWILSILIATSLIVLTCFYLFGRTQNEVAAVYHGSSPVWDVEVAVLKTGEDDVAQYECHMEAVYTGVSSPYDADGRIVFALDTGGVYTYQKDEGLITPGIEKDMVILRDDNVFEILYISPVPPSPGRMVAFINSDKIKLKPTE